MKPSLTEEQKQRFIQALDKIVQQSTEQVKANWRPDMVQWHQYNGAMHLDTYTFGNQNFEAELAKDPIAFHKYVALKNSLNNRSL